MDNFVYMHGRWAEVLWMRTPQLSGKNLELWKALHEDGSHVPFEEKLERYGAECRVTFSPQLLLRLCHVPEWYMGCRFLQLKV